MKFILTSGLIILFLMLSLDIKAISNAFFSGDSDKKFICQLFNPSKVDQPTLVEIYASECNTEKRFCFASKTEYNHKIYNTGVIECNADLHNCFYYFPPQTFSKNLKREYFSCKQV